MPRPHPCLGQSADGVDPAVLTSLLLNVTLCCLKREDWPPAAEAASMVVDEAGDIASRTKAWLRLAKARGEMGHTWHAEQCLAKVKAAGNKAGAGTTSRRAAREAAAYLKLLRERNKKTKRDFGKIFDGQDVLYSEHEQALLRKRANLDAKASTKVHAGLVEQHQRTAAQTSYTERSQALDWHDILRLTQASPSSKFRSKVLKEQANDDPNYVRNRMLYRLSNSDAEMYNAMEDAGASDSQLEEFYAVSRRQERNRIAARMSHEDRDRFQRLLAQEASHNELDDCFDDIKRATELREQARATKQMWFDTDKWPASKPSSKAKIINRTVHRQHRKKNVASRQRVGGQAPFLSDKNTLPVASTTRELDPMPGMSIWRFRPKREQKKTATPQERAELQLSIDRQMEQAGLAYPTSPAGDLINCWKLRIAAACFQACRYVQHAWVVFRRGRILIEDVKKRRARKFATALH